MTGPRVPIALFAHDERSEGVYREWAARLAEHALAVVPRLDQDPARVAEELSRLPPDVPTVHVVASQALWATRTPTGGSRWDADIVFVLDTGRWPAAPFGDPARAPGTPRLVMFLGEPAGPPAKPLFATGIPGADPRIRLLPVQRDRLLDTGSPVPDVLRAILRTEVINDVGPPDERQAQEGQP